MTELHGPPVSENAADDPEEALAQRERAVALKERALTARAEVARLGLPAQVADALDLNTDEGLASGLRLVKLLSSLAPPPPPKAHTGLPSARDLSYRALANLYHADPASYRQHTQQKKLGGQEQWT